MAAHYTTAGGGSTKDLELHACKTDHYTLRNTMMKTGQDVRETALYASDCCGDEQVLEKDASFPRCGKCKGLSTWEEVDLPIQQAA
jgi:hypothetical protein